MIGRCTRAVDFKAALGAVLNKPGAKVLFDNCMCGIHDVQGATNLMLTEESLSSPRSDTMARGTHAIDPTVRIAADIEMMNHRRPLRP